MKNEEDSPQERVMSPAARNILVLFMGWLVLMPLISWIMMITHESIILERLKEVMLYLQMSCS